MFIFAVPQNHCAVIEMFGKPVSVKLSGLNFYIPFLQKLKRVNWERTQTDGKFIQLAEQIMDTPIRPCVTKDNANLEVSCVIRWRITDAKKAVYDVSDIHKFIQELVLNEMRAMIGSRNFDEVNSSRAKLSEEVVQTISKTTSRWGVNISSVEIREFHIDEATRDTMREQIAAERYKRATILKAEGDSEAIKLRAQAAKEALQLTTEAEATYVSNMSRIIGQEEAVKALFNRQTLEGYKTITDNPASKVYLPANMPTMLTPQN